jgi:hypothetical protein
VSTGLPTAPCSQILTLSVHLYFVIRRRQRASGNLGTKRAAVIVPE